MKIRFLSALVIFPAVLFYLVGFFDSSPATARQSQISVEPAGVDVRSRSFAELRARADTDGPVRVIVGLSSTFKPEGNLRANELASQRNSIKRAQSDFLLRYGAIKQNSVKTFEYVPYLAFEADAPSLKQMEIDPSVVSIQEDTIGQASLAESIPMVHADQAWSSGYTGSGQTLAIVDTGVDKNHTFLSPRIVSEACYSSNIAGRSVSVCPGVVTSSTAVDSGLNCSLTVNGCNHGTHVAGIAAGKGTSFSGVAKDANIVAIQVFSRFDSTTDCGSGAAPCALYWTSDLILGLERVRTLKASIPSIMAVNLSLQTGQQFASNCDVAHSATKAAIDNLRSLGVATIVCSGNFSFTTALTAPACISSAVSVGSVDDGSLGTTFGIVSSFSDSSPRLRILAPGRWINSSVPGNQFANFSGTSMATPHVVGAFALMRQKYPNASVGQIVKALTISGTPVTDSRNGLVKPLLNVNAALSVVNKATPFDFDDDGKSDVSIYRPGASSEWWLLRSSDGSTLGLSFGTTGDITVPADFTGDGKTDVAVYRPSNGTWYILRSEDFSFYGFPFGASTDIPAPADFDGDGKADAAVYRPLTGAWYILGSQAGFLGISFGAAEDRPVPGDYDGDEKADIAVFRPSNGGWYVFGSQAGFSGVQFGEAMDLTVPADYDGDGRVDVAVFRPSNGTWYILGSKNGFYGFHFGLGTDKPVPGDYDGDGKADAAVFRGSQGAWYVLGSAAGFSGTTFGLPTDQPVPAINVR